MSLGPVMVDLEGLEPTAPELELLRAPGVAGIVLFSRNYESPEQVRALVRAVHAVRTPPLLVGVDHEGGRVQRFREGFTALPAAARYGEAYDADAEDGLRAAELGGWLMAAELRRVGVDFSFAPVLDLRSAASPAIGERAFHREPEAAARLARAFARGMRAAGMGAVGKHFPGHGMVVEDSHHTLPRDDRDLESLRLADLLVFERLVGAGLPAVMPAHVVYPAVDARPAGFSRRWLAGVLRGELGFQGAVFSDDLSMAGAEAGGTFPERAAAALDAGCDVVLVCNRPEDAAEVVASIGGRPDAVRGSRLARMHGREAGEGPPPAADSRYQEAVRRVCELLEAPELGLGDDAHA